MLGLKRRPAIGINVGDTTYRVVQGREVAKRALDLLRRESPDADFVTLTENDLGLAMTSHGRLVAASVLHAQPSVSDPTRGVFNLADVVVAPQARGRKLGRVLLQLTARELDSGDVLVGQCPSALVGIITALGLTVLPAGEPLDLPELGGAALNYTPWRPHWFYQHI